MEENEEKISKYSTGVNINLRLDQLWKDTHNHSRSNNFKLWNLDLDCIWAELARDLGKKKNKDDESFEDIEKNFKKFDDEIKRIGPITDILQKGFKGMSKDDIEKRDKHYSVLRNKQIFLARLENKLGKGTSWETDDEDDL